MNLLRLIRNKDEHPVIGERPLRELVTASDVLSAVTLADKLVRQYRQSQDDTRTRRDIETLRVALQQEVDAFMAHTITVVAGLPQLRPYLPGTAMEWMKFSTRNSALLQRMEGIEGSQASLQKSSSSLLALHEKVFFFILLTSLTPCRMLRSASHRRPF